MNLPETLQLLVILLTLATGCLVLIPLSAHQHKHSTLLYFVVAAGLIHEVFYAICWLKVIFRFAFIRPWVLDIYTFPMACFVITAAMIFISFAAEKSSKSRTFTLVFYILCSLFMIVGMQQSLQSCAYDTYFMIGSGSESDRLNSPLYGICGYIDPELVCIFLEYILIYLTLTILFIKNSHGASVVKMMFSTALKSVNGSCPTCQFNHSVCMYTATFFLVVIWLIRPVLLTVNTYYNFMKQDNIPSISMLIIYVCLLAYYINDHGVFDTTTYVCLNMETNDDEKKDKGFVNGTIEKDQKAEVHCT